MTNPYRAMCAELVDAWASGKSLASSIVRARALLDQPEFIEDRIAKADAAIEASMERIRAIAAAPARDLDQQELQPPVAGEVAAALIELRSTAMGLDQMKMYVAAQRVGRAADLLERLASDNAGLQAAADSLWADNVSLLDN